MITDKEISAFLDCQPFAASGNCSTRMWELFRNTDPEALRSAVAFALAAVANEMENTYVITYATRDAEGNVVTVRNAIRDWPMWLQDATQ